MGRPTMTDERRAVAVELLANAIRRDERLWSRERDEARADLALALRARWRADASWAYLRGMRDLLAVLFASDKEVADACYGAARAQALGTEGLEETA